MHSRHSFVGIALRGVLLGAAVLALSAPNVNADSDSSSTVAVWITHPGSVAGVGALGDYLLDRLGSNGWYPITDPEQVRAAGSFVGLDRTTNFDKVRLAALGKSLGARWVIWVKVADRAVEYKKGLSIPHLFIRRKVVTRMLVDARVVDVRSGGLLGSNRWRVDKSGAGSYQVAEDVRQDPIYNNSADQFYRYERELEWETARNISVWFKSLVARPGDPPAQTQVPTPVLNRGPFGTSEKPKRK